RHAARGDRAAAGRARRSARRRAPADRPPPRRGRRRRRAARPRGGALVSDHAAAAPLSASAQKVQDALRARGLPNTVIELPGPLRPAADAAREGGGEVAQIGKSIIFRAPGSGRGVLVLTSGAHRVDESIIAGLLGEAIERADPAFVRDATGYAIGGVPPLGHA